MFPMMNPTMNGMTFPGQNPALAPQAPGMQQPAPQPPMPPQAQAGANPAPPPVVDPGSDFGDLDPDQLQRLADAHGISYKEAAAMLRMRRAEALAGRGMPQGRTAGNVFVASNPLESISSALMQGMGLRDMKKAANEMSGLGDRYSNDALAGYQMMGGRGLGF